MPLRISEKNKITRLKLTADKPSGLSIGKAGTEKNTLHLLVGLGGSGCDMLREAKGLINRHCRDDHDKTKPPHRVMYLGIDTDNSRRGPLRSAWECTDGTHVTLDAHRQPSETLHLFYPAVQGPILPAHYPHIFQWLDANRIDRLSVEADGAGGIRQVGRVRLFLSMESVLRRIDEVLNDAGYGGEYQRVNIYILSGLSGGTGSGTFLDMAYILRRKVKEGLRFKGAQVCVFGYLMMPDVHLRKAGHGGWDYLRRNGYEALRELEHLTTLSRQGGVYEQQYLPGVFCVRSEEPPFDFTHLLGHSDVTGSGSAEDYRQITATVARSILGFVAALPQPPDETADLAYRKTEPVSYLLYSGANAIVAAASDFRCPYRERMYTYQALGSGEFALPRDKMYKYMLTRLFRGMNGLFANEPDRRDAAEIATSLGLEEKAWIRKMIGRESDVFPVSDYRASDAFGVDADNEHEAIIRKRLYLAREEMEERFTWIRNDLPRKSEEILNGSFTDPQRGPVWVSHLISRYLNPYLADAQMGYVMAVQERRNQIRQIRSEREKIRKGFHTGFKAKEYMRTWNEEYRLKLEIMALSFLYADDGGQDLSMTDYAREVLARQNAQRYEVIADVLTTAADVAAANTNAVENAAEKKTDPYSWETPTLPQVRSVIDELFDNTFDKDRLVRDFLPELLDAGKRWAPAQIDLIGLLQSYFEKYLQAITDKSLEFYLQALYVGDGKPYGSLEEALTHDGALFDQLINKAECLLMTTPKPYGKYILEVPADSPEICDLAEQYVKKCGHHQMQVQRSGIRDRISVHQVGFTVALYQYKEFADCESDYHRQTSAEPAGACLGGNLWNSVPHTLLPSPIPRRTRIPGYSIYPEAVKTSEEKHGAVFRELLTTPAVRMETEKDKRASCIFVKSEKWENCGIEVLLGTNSQAEVDYSALKYGAGWDLRKTERVLKTLQAFREKGLPVMPGMVYEGNMLLPTRLTVWENRNDFADETMKKADLDLEYQKTAEEYYLASTVLRVWGEEELSKYRRLDKHIRDLQEVLASAKA